MVLIVRAAHRGRRSWDPGHGNEPCCQTVACISLTGRLPRRQDAMNRSERGLVPPPPGQQIDPHSAVAGEVTGAHDASLKTERGEPQLGVWSVPAGSEMQ